MKLSVIALCVSLLGCSQSATPSARIDEPPAGELASEPMPGSTASIAINGMLCQGCAESVRAQLEAMEGVHEAQVSFTDGTARVRYDPARWQPTQLAVAIERLERAQGAPPLEARVVDPIEEASSRP